MHRFVHQQLTWKAAGLALMFLAWTLTAQTVAPFGNLPLSFEAGAAGQFAARGRDAQFTLTPAGAQLMLRPTPNEPMRSVQMQFVGASPQAVVQGDGELTGKINYLVGNDPAKWRAGIPTFARVQVAGVYPGINLVYYGNQQQVEYDFNLAAGVSPGKIAIRFSGADKVSVDGQGALVLTLGHSEIRQPKPVIYQTVGNLRKAISGGYQMLDDRTVAFAVGPHDPALPLVIDPVLSYSSYFGGTAGDTAWAVAVDTNGFVYVAGQTFSAFRSNSVPFSTVGAFQTNFAGGSQTGDAFVAKFDNSGTNLIYQTYLGGSGDEAVYALAVNGAGQAFVSGATDSRNFPIKNAVVNGGYNGTNISGVAGKLGNFPTDAFVTELNTNGASLIYSTFLGGSSSEAAYGIAVDPAGAAYVTGFTYSSNFPTVNALQNHLACPNNNYYNANAFVAEVAPGGGSLIFSTYLGGTNYDQGRGIAVDASGIYVTGYSASTNFPTTNFIAQTIGTNLYIGNQLNSTTNYTLSDDAFVTKYAPGGTSLIYSTLLGSSNTDIGSQIAVDAAGNAYVAGYTTSTNFPNTATNVAGLSSFLVTNNQSIVVTNAFLTQITWNGTNAGIGYSAVFGGQGVDAANALAVDAAGNAFVVGNASSGNFPTFNTNGALSGVNSGGFDVFITAFNTNGTALLYSAYLGGNGNDEAYGVALDSADNAFIVGQTTSTTFPTVNPMQPHLNGPSDTFIAEINSFPFAPVITTQPTNQSVGVAGSVSFVVAATGTSPLSYQWQLNGTNLQSGTTISGVTNSSLTINNAQVTNSGTYAVIVMNGGGSVTSSNAVLTVTNVATSLTQQPVSQTVAVGATASFSASGNAQQPYTLHWQKDGTNVMDGLTPGGSTISGFTNGTLNISNAQTNDNGNYALVISNIWGVYTSSNAVLTVVSFPTITVSPTNQMVGLGAAVKFAVTAVGTGTLSYQWQFNGGNLTDDGTNISGSATATLSLKNVQPAADGGYAVVVTNSVGSVTSAPPAVLTVLTVPTFTGITVAGTNGGFVLSGTGGTNGGTYTVFASTNLATPLNQWTLINAYQFGSQGQFAFTNLPPSDLPQRFYLLRLPSP